MNANELLNLGNELTKLNDEHLAQRVMDESDVQVFIYEAIEAISATIPRETAQVKPTREDNSKCLCAIDDMGSWHFKKWYEIADNPSTYLYWLIMPTAPKAEGKEDV